MRLILKKIQTPELTDGVLVASPIIAQTGNTGNKFPPVRFISQYYWLRCEKNLTWDLYGVLCLRLLLCVRVCACVRTNFCNLKFIVIQCHFQPPLRSTGFYNINLLFGIWILESLTIKSITLISQCEIIP